MKLPCRMKYWRREWEEIPINELDQEGCCMEERREPCNRIAVLNGSGYRHLDVHHPGPHAFEYLYCCERRS